MCARGHSIAVCICSQCRWGTYAVNAAAYSVVCGMAYFGTTVHSGCIDGLHNIAQIEVYTCGDLRQLAATCDNLRPGHSSCAELVT